MGSKKSSSKQKLSKKELRQQQIAREKRKKQLMIGLPIAIVVLVIVGIGVYRFTRPDVEGVLSFGTLLRGHDRSVSFANANLPPTGGTHNPNWQNCGIYTTPVDTSAAVHSLEHGAVWLAYRPDLPPEQVGELQDLVRGNGYALMSPYPDLESDVVMSAWSKQLVIDSLPDERIEEFLGRYTARGPEPGARCNGGIGQPVQ